MKHNVSNRKTPSSITATASFMVVATVAAMALTGTSLSGCSDDAPAHVDGDPCETYFDCEFGYTCIDNICMVASGNNNTTDTGTNNQPDTGLDLDTTIPDGECVDDSLAGNHSQGEAHPIQAGVLSGLVICGTNSDWFSLDLSSASSTVNVTATFSKELTQDHSLTLYRADGSAVTTGEPSDRNLKLSTTIHETGKFAIRVAVDNNAHSETAHQYTLSVAISTTGGGDDDTGVDEQDTMVEPDEDTGTGTGEEPDTGDGGGDPGDECLDDRYAGNHTDQFAALIEPGSFQPLAICGDNDDWFLFEALEGSTIKINVTFSNGNSDLDIELYDGYLDLLNSSTDTITIEQIEYTTYYTDSYYLRVLKYDGPDTTYTMTLEIIPPEPVEIPCRTIIRCMVNDCTDDQACEADCMDEGSQEAQQEAQELLSCIETTAECTGILPEACWSETCAAERDLCFPEITGDYGCSDVLTCIWYYCGDDDWLCQFECRENGTAEAQDQLEALDSCLVAHCVNPEDGSPIGGGSCASDNCQVELDACYGY